MIHGILQFQQSYDYLEFSQFWAVAILQKSQHSLKNTIIESGSFAKPKTLLIYIYFSKQKFCITFIVHIFGVKAVKKGYFL